MPLRYDSPGTGGSLQQGEILCDIWEHRALIPAAGIDRGDEVPVRQVFHRRVIVMNPYCDLLWDYRSRDAPLEFVAPEPREADEPGDAIEEQDEPVPYVILCDAYVEEEIRNRAGINRGVWQDMKKNNLLRYHFLPEGILERDEAQDDLPEPRMIPALYLDFKRVFTVPTKLLYPALATDDVGRLARLPDLFREDLAQRFTSFLGRVSLPEVE